MPHGMDPLLQMEQRTWTSASWEFCTAPRPGCFATFALSSSYSLFVIHVGIGGICLHPPHSEGTPIPSWVCPLTSCVSALCIWLMSVRHKRSFIHVTLFVTYFFKTGAVRRAINCFWVTLKQWWFQGRVGLARSSNVDVVLFGEGKCSRACNWSPLPNKTSDGITYRYHANAHHKDTKWSWGSDRISQRIWATKFPLLPTVVCFNSTRETIDDLRSNNRRSRTPIPKTPTSGLYDGKQTSVGS